MNKMAGLIVFAVVFSVLSTKPMAAFDLSKLKNDVKKAVTDSATNTALKAAAKAIEPKGPVKEIQITGVPSEYEGYFAIIMAALPEDPMDACIPSYLTLGSNGTLLDTVKTGQVKVHTPCDDKKRLISITFSKTKDKDTTSTAAFIYVKNAGKDVCKSKTAMPAYKLLEKQTFSFSDFMTNESCKKIADGTAKAKK